MSHQAVFICDFCQCITTGGHLRAGLNLIDPPSGWKEIVNPDKSVDHFCKGCLDACDVLKTQRLKEWRGKVVSASNGNKPKPAPTSAPKPKGKR